MALSDLEWTQKLTEAVSNAVPTLYGEDASLASYEPERIDRRYSFMFRYHIKLPNAASRKVLVKIPRESWARFMDEAITSENIQAWTRREFDVMTLIADIIESSNESGLFAIRPGAFFPEFGALLVEEYSLRMLKTSLARLPLVLGSQKAWKDFEKQAELAGVWLRVIQKHTGTEQIKPLAALAIQKRLDDDFSVLEKTSGRSWSNLQNQFRQLYESIRSKEIPLAALHNDYHLGNIFVMDDGRVGVLDPNWVESGSIYEDLSSLLIDPVTRKAQVISLGLLFRPSMYGRYERAVLRGYYGDSKIPLALIHFYCALDVLFKWRTDEEIFREESSPAHTFLSILITPVFRYYFQRLILQYLNWGITALDTTAG